MADIKVETGSRRWDSTHLESTWSAMHPLVSWRSMLGGLLVAFLSLGILVSLGMAFGGISLRDGVESGVQGAGIFTGVWFLVSTIIALFIGAYFAARISKFQNNRIGSAQGLVIAALFMGFILWQTMAAIGWAGEKTAGAIGGTASAIGTVADNPAVQDVVSGAMDDLQLRADPQVVATGVLSRILRGDTESAQAYLARMSGISQAEAQQRIARVRAQVDQAVIQARQTAAQALSAVGWSLFFTLLLGTAAAISGGALGSRANFRKPLAREQVEGLSDFRTAPV